LLRLCVRQIPLPESGVARARPLVLLARLISRPILFLQEHNVLFADRILFRFQCVLCSGENLLKIAIGVFGT